MQIWHHPTVTYRSQPHQALRRRRKSNSPLPRKWTRRYPVLRDRRLYLSFRPLPRATIIRTLALYLLHRPLIWHRQSPPRSQHPRKKHCWLSRPLQCRFPREPFRLAKAWEDRYLVRLGPSPLPHYFRSTSLTQPVQIASFRRTRSQLSPSLTLRPLVRSPTRRDRSLA